MTTPYQQPGAPLGAYTSPIPVRDAHLGDALASEWTKIRSVRSTVWTLGVMILLMFGIGLGVAALVAAAGESAGMGEVSALGMGFFGVLPGSICVVTLGVLTIASEYGTGMIRTTLTACPSRARVLAAKAIVFFLLVFVITTVVAAIVAGIQYGMVEAAEPTGDEWLRATVGVGLFVAALGLVSLGVGGMLRHSAGAITTMIGVILMPLVAALFMFSETMADVQEFLFEYAIPSQLIGIYGEAASGGSSGAVGWTPVWIMFGLAALSLGGALTVINSRDV
ncbi:ABC transporter permease [Streptomyces sp. NPDC005805]|uniref:ABC transporter permease n=1 Tax=Streptomyces sp. NPDC005805 TaxID=3157068 RepID=UPI003411B624